MLPVTMHYLDDPVLERPSPEQLTARLDLVGGVGEGLDIRGAPGGPEGHLRIVRGGSGRYEVIYRPANVALPGLHAAADGLPAAEETVLAWCGGDERWRTLLDWRTIGPFDTPELPDEARTEAEKVARSAIHTGFIDKEQAADAILGVMPEPVAGRDPITRDEAARVAEAVWKQRLDEEAGWPEVTDPDLVWRAFTALAAQGITARANFQCCSRCAISAIGGEAAEGDHGFVLFHGQDTANAADGGALSVRYGHYNGTREQNAAVGRVVSRALTEAGLRVEWSGDPGRVITVPLEWRKRVGS